MSVPEGWKNLGYKSVKGKSLKDFVPPVVQKRMIILSLRKKMATGLYFCFCRFCTVIQLQFLCSLISLGWNHSLCFLIPLNLLPSSVKHLFQSVAPVSPWDQDFSCLQWVHFSSPLPPPHFPYTLYISFCILLSFNYLQGPPDLLLVENRLHCEQSTGWDRATK